MIGNRLANRYEIVRELGRGGMGVVYLGHDPVLDRNVAIKVVMPNMVSAESVERFKREARVVAKMDHPSIVSVHDSGEHDGSLFFVMPFVEGANLRSVLRKEALSLGDLIDVAVQIAEALEYSHARGVVHRDIKPENLMVTHKEGEGIRVRVTDFGLAMAPLQERITKTATIVGTLAYMSPEQVAGKEIDARSDIYAFGTVLYECLVGEPPFSGEVQVLLYRIAHEIPAPPRSLQLDIDEEIEDVVMRCLEKDPSKRPTGKEIVEILSSYRRKLLSSGRNRTMLPSSLTLSFQIPRPATRPFVGRDKEFADLQRRLNAAISGECQIVLVAGEAGIGKSRLVEELENLARVRSIGVYHGRFVEVSHPLPYQGYCDVIQEYFRSKSSSVTPVDFSDLAPELIALFPVLAEIKELAVHSEESARSMQETGVRKFEDRTYIFELLARTITRIAGGKAVVLLFEDLHSANVSIEALDYIVRRLGPTPTLIIGTYRTTEIDKRHPVMNLLSGFKGDKRFALLQLAPLSASGHRQFLEMLMGGSKLGDDLVQKFYDATEGNPYFTSELVRSLMDSGGIVRDETGSYKLSSETALSIEELPVTIQQTVEERIERLPKDLREILAIASVLGKNFEFGDLERLASEHENPESVVEQLIRDGFIEEDRQSRSDRLSFSSGVVRDVLYSSLPRRRRRALHRKHAEEIEKRNPGRLDRVYPQLFEHYVQADIPEKVVEYGFLLAKKSLDAFSPDDAITVLQTVLDFSAEEGRERLVEAEAKTLLAAAHRMMGTVTLALEELEAAIQIFEKERDAPRLITCVLTAAEIAWQGRKVNEARRWVDKGLELSAIQKDSASMTQLLSLAVTIANLRGEYDKAREYLDRAERLKPRIEEVQEELPHGGTLVVPLTNPCKARHPVTAFFNEETEILTNIFETLVNSNAQGNLVPHLCERWEALEHGAVFQFMLRKDLRLHDGRNLTAADVKKSFEDAIATPTEGLSPAYASIRGASEHRSGVASGVEGIKALSDHTIQIELEKALPIYPALLTDLRSAIAVKTDADPADGAAFVGTGPFKMGSVSKDAIHLQRNRNYWKGTSALVDGLDFRTSLSSAEVAQGFRSGKFDIVRDLLPENLEEILRDRQLHATLVESPKKNTYFTVFNTSSKICKNLNVRRALAGVIRTRDLVRSTLGRFADPAEGLLPPGILGHDPDRRSQPVSMEKEAELLQSSGFSIPIQLKASIHPILQDRYSSFTKALLRSWLDLGVETSILTPDMATYNRSFSNNEGVDVLIGRWIADYDDPDTFTYGLFHSEFGQFRHYHSSKDLDELMEAARGKSEPSDRERIYRKIEAFLSESAILHPLFHEIDYRIASPKVQRLVLRSTPPYVNYSELSKTETATQPVARKAQGGVLHIPTVADLKALDPAAVVTNSQACTLATVFETLLATEGARIIPCLAASFQAEDGARRFRFQLRNDVRFHDGRRLTARDVRFSFEHLLLSAESSYRQFLSAIRGAREILKGDTTELKGFRILSSTEFLIELDEPLPFFPALLAFNVTSIIPEGTEKFHGNWKDGCIGTGPFRVSSFDPGRSLKVEANPGYWRNGLPKSEALEFTFGNSPQQIVAGFRNGQFSVATDLVPSDVEALLHGSTFAAKYQDIPGLSTYYIVFNIHRGPFADEAIRQRFVEAIDVEPFIHRALGRLAVPAMSLTPPALLGYQPSRRSVSPLRPKKLQPPVEVTAMVHSIYEGNFASVKEELFTILNEAGFKIKVVDTKAEYYEPVEIPSGDFVLTRWIADYPDADTFILSLLHSEKGWEGKFCGGPDLDKIMENARCETDFTTRHSIYRQIEEILQQRSLVLPLFHEQSYCFTRPEVEGLELSFFSPYIHWEKAWIPR